MALVVFGDHIWTAKYFSISFPSQYPLTSQHPLYWGCQSLTGSGASRRLGAVGTPECSLAWLSSKEIFSLKILVWQIFPLLLRNLYLKDYKWYRINNSKLLVLKINKRLPNRISYFSGSFLSTVPRERRNSNNSVQPLSIWSADQRESSLFFKVRPI